MADRQSVFTPLDPQQMEGPFSGFLRPPEPQQQQSMPAAPLSAAGGIAMAANAFLQGASKRRITNYEEQENAKIQNWNKLNSYVTRVFPTLTPEGQQQIQQLYNRALGPEVLSTIDGQTKGKKGKGKGEGEGGAGHHFTNILRDVAIGMTGGNTPKGAPNVDPHAVIGNMAMIASDPKYSREGVMTGEETAIEGKLKGFSGSREEASALIAPHLQAIARLDESRGQRAGSNYLGAYQPSPAVGSPAAVAAGLMKNAERPGPPAGPATGGASAPPSPVTSAPPSMLSRETPGVAASASVAPGPPAEPQFDRTRAMLYGYSGIGNLSEPKDIEFTGPEGKKQTATAYHVNNPEFSGWVNTDTNQPIKGSVRLVSTAEPKQERFSPISAPIKGEAAWGGDPKKWYRIQKSLDDPKNVHIIGEVHDPAAARRVAARPASPQMQLAQRKVSVMDAMSKVLTQTPPPKDEKGRPLRGMAEAQYYLDHIQQFYQKDKSVSPYLAELKDWLTTEARKESFKEPGDVLRILKENAPKAQQDLEHQQQTEDVQRAVQDTLVEWLPELGGGGSNSGDSTSYDEVVK